MITLFNTPTAEVNKMTRFEHTVVIRDSIQELCDKGEDYHKLLAHLNHKIELERKK